MIRQDQSRLSRPAPWGLWLALALPVFWVCLPLLQGAEWRAAIRPSGDVATKLMILAIGIGPLRRLTGPLVLLDWLVARRRSLGVAAFLYSAIHLIVFAASIGRLDWILQGMAYASMWTGWIAFALLAIVASISNDSMVSRLRRTWKRIQRLVYPAAILTFVHWLLLSRSPIETLAHFIPLVLIVVVAWIAMRLRRRRAAQGGAGQ